MEAVIAGGEAARERLAAFVQTARAAASAPWMLEEATLHLGPCIPGPSKIIRTSAPLGTRRIKSGTAL